jgi:predicted RND superfamily exporter protein/CRP-like cAMP-binding protein
MSKLMLFAARWPWFVLVIVSLASIFAIIQLPALKLEIAAEGMMVEDDPARIFYQQTLDTFGSENISIVFLQDEDLFQPDKLAAIQQAVNKINKSPLVQRTDSLFSRRYLRTIDGYIYTDPYLRKIPAKTSESEAIKQAAIRNPLIVRNLLSQDGKAMAINIYFDHRKYERGFDQAATRMLDEALAPLRDKLQTFFHVGDPYVRSGISHRIKQDQVNIVPLSLLLLVVTLVIALRHLAVALIPLVTAGFSILWTLGLMAAQDIPINIMTSIIPALLIIIGSTEDIHLLTEYKTGLHKGYRSGKAIRFMAKNMGMAVSLTFITTYLGFLSIAFNDLALLRQFGLVASTGLALNFLATALLVPASLKLFGSRKNRQEENNKLDLFTRLALKLLQYLKGHRPHVTIGLLLLSVIAVNGALQMRVNNNVMDYFSDSSSFAKYVEIVHERLSGIQTLSIVVSGQPDSFLKVTRLEELQSLQQLLEDSGDFDSSYSYADFIGVLHSGMDSETPSDPYLPTRNEVVGEYSHMLDSEVLKPFVSDDFSQARIIVRHNIGSSHKLNQSVADFLDYAREWLTPGLTIHVTGESYLNNQAVDYMADGQARSLALMLLVIFLLVSALFMQIKAGMIAVIANLFPILVLFGVMGYLDLALDTGTAMVAAIAMGIVVDHSMHFMVRYQRAGQVSATPLEDAVRTEATPIIATAIALAVGFATLSLSDFPPVARFGLLSALVMLLALISTFLITPLLLWHIRLTSAWDILSMKVRQQVIDDCPLFVGMRNWQAKKVIALSQLQEFHQDEAIFLQGQKAHYMRVVLEGKAEVWRTHVDGSTHLVNTLNAGDVFGICSLIRTRKREANVIAIEPTRVLALSWLSIHQIARTYPRLSSRLFHNLSVIVGDLIGRVENGRTCILDELSGTYNATYFVDLLKFATDNANRQDEDLSLMSLEVIYDKTGENALNWQDMANYTREIAETITTALSKGDAVSRWKAQVFWAVLPYTDTNQAKLVGQRILKQLQELDCIHDSRARVDVYITELKRGEEAADLIDRANENRTSSSSVEKLY